MFSKSPVLKGYPSVVDLGGLQLSRHWPASISLIQTFILSESCITVHKTLNRNTITIIYYSVTVMLLGFLHYILHYIKHLPLSMIQNTYVQYIRLAKYSYTCNVTCILSHVHVFASNNAYIHKYKNIHRPCGLKQPHRTGIIKNRLIHLQHL